MTKEEIQNSLKILERTQSIKKQLKNLKIDWETDLEKMNFSLLRSNPHCNIKNSYIEKLDLTKTHHWEGAKTDIGLIIKDIITINLITFIDDGNKIIPPLYIKPFEYDGENYSIKEIQELRQLDGGHRLFLSAAIGLKEIPIIIHEKIVKYYFPVSKWDFECTDESFIAKSKDGNHIFEIDVNRLWIEDELFYKNILLVISN